MRITHNAILNAQRYSPDFVGRDYPAIGAALRRQILAGEEVPRDRLTVEITPGGRAVRLTSRTESGEPMGAIVVPDTSVDASPGDLVCVTVGPLSGPAFTAPTAKPHSIALDEGTIRRIAEMVADLIGGRRGCGMSGAIPLAHNGVTYAWLCPEPNCGEGDAAAVGTVRP